jgi:hypothetical protein
MVKIEEYIEVQTHVGLTKFLSSVSNVTGRMELNFAFVPASYNILRIQYCYPVEVSTRSHKYNIGNSVVFEKEE